MVQKNPSRKTVKVLPLRYSWGNYYFRGYQGSHQCIDYFFKGPNQYPWSESTHCTIKTYSQTTSWAPSALWADGSDAGQRGWAHDSQSPKACACVLAVCFRKTYSTFSASRAVGTELTERLGGQDVRVCRQCSELPVLTVRERSLSITVSPPSSYHH